MALPLARLSPFVYPNRRAGIDQSHVAAKFLAPGKGFSVVALNNGNFVTLLTGKGGTKGAAAAAGVDGNIGPSVAWSALTSTSGVTITGQTTFLPVGLVMAGIVRPIVSSTTAARTVLSLRGSSAGGPDMLVKISSTQGIGFCWDNTNGIINWSSTINIALNTPYFVALSLNTTSTGANFIAVNLQTGQVQTGNTTFTLPNGGTSVAATQNIGFGGALTSGDSFGGNIAAAMWASGYLSLAQLQQWGADPWAFWFPRTAMGPLDFVPPEIGSSATQINATVAQTLGGLVQTATAQVIDTAAAAQTLGALVQALTGTVIDSATVSQALGNLGQTTTAAVTDTINVSQTLGALGQTATAATGANITVAQTLGALGQTATATVGLKLTVAQVLGALSQIATGGVEAHAIAGQILGALQQVATGALGASPRVAVANQVLGALGQTATASVPVLGAEPTVWRVVQSTVGPPLTFPAWEISGDVGASPITHPTWTVVP